MRPLYETRGRIRVSFPKITVADAKDLKGLLVKVTVEEGPSYDLGEVRVEGNSQVKAEYLLKAADFKTGDLANFEEIGRGMQRLRKALERNGFMRAETEVERRIDDGKKLINLIVRVREGPQFTFSKLTIQGLDIHAEAAIKKLWALKEGKPFNADYPDYFLSRVREDGFFENLKKTSSKIEVRENSNTVDVTLLFQ